MTDLDAIIGAIKDFDFDDYGLDAVDPWSEYAEWVPDLARAIAASLAPVPADAEAVTA